MESIGSEGMPVSVTTHHVSRTPNGNPKLTKNSGFPKFISAILSDVEKFTEFNGTIIQIPEKYEWRRLKMSAAWPSRIKARRRCSLLFAIYLTAFETWRSVREKRWTIHNAASPNTTCRDKSGDNVHCMNVVNEYMKEKIKIHAVWSRYKMRSNVGYSTASMKKNTVLPD